MDPVTLSMAKADAKKRYATIIDLSSTQRQVPVPVATRATPPMDNAVGLSDGTIVGGTAKYAHVAVRTCFGIQLAYSNFFSGASNTEQDGPNPITIRAAVEPFGNVIMPVTFNGARSIVIEPGCTVLSDPVGVDIIKGATFWSRTHVSVTAGQKFPRSGIPVASSGEGHNYGTTLGADLTATGSASLTGQNVNSHALGPSAILGKVIDPGKPVIGLPGDSIMAGTGDAPYIGFAQRALGGNYSFQKVAYPGEAMSGWANVANNTGLTRFRRLGLLGRVAMTHILTDYTVNSVAVTTLLADAVVMWLSFARFGVPVYQTTLTPQTTSTDAWATVANQSLFRAQADEDRRVAFNTWLRDGAPVNGVTPQAPGASGAGIVRAGSVGHPLAGIVEVADLAESARNSGRWKAGYTADGTHPNPTGAAALSAAINPTALFGPVAA